VKKTKSSRKRPKLSPKSFFTQDQIPKSLVQKNETGCVLTLPPQFVLIYREMLKSLGLLKLAECQTPNDEGPQGGKTKEETYTHFAKSFSGSAARVQLVLLDPTEEFKTTRDVFVRLLSGGRLELLDVPCGCGATGAVIVCLVAELRRAKVLPKIPLHINITGWDISASARNLKRDMFRKLKSILVNDGIRINTRIRKWDVTDEELTSERIAGWLKAKEKSAAVGVIAANFSGFLSSKIKECKNQLRELLRYARQEKATVLWIEPQTNAALEKMFPELIKHVLKQPFQLQVCWPEKSIPRKARSEVLHPVQKTGRFRVQASALHLEPGGRV
jgi:hypothetical protein